VIYFTPEKRTEAIMADRAKKLAQRLKEFGDELTTFVENCSETDWQKRCAWEDWSVGVTMRHIGAGHFQVVDLVKMVVAGKKLPEFTAEQITRMANEHAREHAACTRPEVLEILRRSSADFVDYTAGLSDDDLDRKGHLALAGGEISAENLIKALILKSGGEHFANVKAACKTT
jgi:hypothetical protein